MSSNFISGFVKSITALLDRFALPSCSAGWRSGAGNTIQTLCMNLLRFDIYAHSTDVLQVLRRVYLTDGILHEDGGLHPLHWFNDLCKIGVEPLPTDPLISEVCLVKVLISL